MNFIWNLKRRIRCSFLGRCAVYHQVRFFFKKRFITKVVKKFSATEKTLFAYKKYMKEAFIKYHWDFDEFFMYHFMNLTDEERKNYVPEYDKNIFCDKVNDNSKDLIFHDKWETYKFFKKYFKRDAVLVGCENDLKKDGFSDFIKKHKRFIVKPINAATGRGIQIMSSADIGNIKHLLSTAKSAVVLEELVQQNYELAKFHPKSVNTVRITTFRFDDRIEIIHPFMRVGRGDSVVDNGGQGGLICILDPLKGEILKVGDEVLNVYTKHPDSKYNFVGFCIPKWQEAVALAKELAMSIPSVRYVGWDLALTDSGWVLIEGNEKGQFVGWQLVNQKGFRNEFDKICKEIKVKL